MNFIIIGSGGIGSYYGARLIKKGHNVTFVARNTHLKVIQKNGLLVKHPHFSFSQKVHGISIKDLTSKVLDDCHCIILTTKSTATQEIGKNLQPLYEKSKTKPFILSLQNGVSNETTLQNYLPKDTIIGGITRKIGAHIIENGVIEAVGNAETVIGSLYPSKKIQQFLKTLQQIFIEASIPTDLCDDIKKELWKKLIINNGVNALCALTQEETGVVTKNSKLTRIVYELMKETAHAAKADGVKISNDDVDAMYQLIIKFDSIKPSMLVDRVHKRVLELEDICGIVIEYCEKQNLDAPYTRTVSSILEFIYQKEL